MRLAITTTDELLAAFNAAKERMTRAGFRLSPACRIDEGRMSFYVYSSESTPGTYGHPRASSTYSCGHLREDFA